MLGEHFASWIFNSEVNTHYTDHLLYLISSEATPWLWRMYQNSSTKFDKKWPSMLACIRIWSIFRCNFARVLSHVCHQRLARAKFMCECKWDLRFTVEGNIMSRPCSSPLQTASQVCYANLISWEIITTLRVVCEIVWCEIKTYDYIKKQEWSPTPKPNITGRKLRLCVHMN